MPNATPTSLAVGTRLSIRIPQISSTSLSCTVVCIPRDNSKYPNSYVIQFDDVELGHNYWNNTPHCWFLHSTFKYEALPPKFTPGNNLVLVEDL